MNRKIYVSDITMKLADREAGNPLSFRQKIELSKLLDKLGVSVIEAGPILNGKQDVLLIKSLASAIKNSVLTVPVDIFNPESVDETWKALQGAVHPRLQVSVPVSTVQMEYMCHKKPTAILELVADLVRRCRQLCEDVEFVAEDFGRSEQEFVQKVIKSATDNGATIVTIFDTAGNLFGYEYYKSTKWIRNELPENVRLGVWCSNEMYMADSSAIAAVRAGADEIKTTSYGNMTTSLKRFVKILNAKSDVCEASCDVKIIELQRAVDHIKSVCKADANKPFTNINESDKAAKDMLTIHDDMEAVLKVASKLGYDLDEEDGKKVYDAFVRLASKNETVTTKELDAIVASEANQIPATYNLESYIINSGNNIKSICHLQLKKDNIIKDSVSLGDGPIDAAFLAIEEATGSHYELDDFQIQSVTEGREAMGEAIVKLRSNGNVYSGRGISRDVVGASILAYLNAVNKIVYKED